MRPRQIYGAGNPLPVGRSLFYEKYVQRPGEDENVPGTKVKKLRLDHIGGRLAIAPEDRVFDFVAALLADAYQARHRVARHRERLRANKREARPTAGVRPGFKFLASRKEVSECLIPNRGARQGVPNPSRKSFKSARTSGEFAIPIAVRLSAIAASLAAIVRQLGAAQRQEFFQSLTRGTR